MPEEKNRKYSRDNSNAFEDRHSYIKKIYDSWKELMYRNVGVSMREIPPVPLLYRLEDYYDLASSEAFSRIKRIIARKSRNRRRKEDVSSIRENLDALVKAILGMKISGSIVSLISLNDEYGKAVNAQTIDSIRELVNTVFSTYNIRDDKKKKELIEHLNRLFLPIVIPGTESFGGFAVLPYHEIFLRDKEKRKIGIEGALKSLGIPPEVIIKLSEEDITDLMEKPEKYELLFHHNAPYVANHARKLGIPLKDVLEFLHRHPHRELLITSAHNLPSILFHPEILEHTSKMEYQELKNILFSLTQLSPLLEGEGTTTVKKLIEALRQDRDLYSVITHPLLLRNADLLLHLYRKNKKITKEISKRLDDLNNHNDTTLRSLIQAALEGDEHLLPPLLPHSDLHQHYRVLLSSNLSRDIIERILSHKDRWKDMNPSHVEKLLKTPVGRRLLISSLPKERKIELMKSLQDLTEKDVMVHELAHRYDVPAERVRKVLEELGPERAENFLRTYGDVVSILKGPGFYALIELAKSGSISKKYGKAVARLDGAKFFTSMPIVRIIRALEREGLLPYFLSMNPSRVERFLSYPSRDVNSIVENIRYMRKLNQSIPTSYPSEKKKRTTPKNFRSEEELRNFIRSNIVRLGKKKVILRGGLVEIFGTNKNHMTREEFEGKLRKWLMRSRIRNRLLDDERIENIVNDILGSKRRRPAEQQPPKRQPTTESAPEITRLEGKDIGRMKSILDSINRALNEGSAKIHEIKGSYVTFRVLKETHNSKVLLSKEFRSRVNVLVGSPTTKESNYVKIPLSFFKNLMSHPDLMTHPLLTLLFQRAKKKLTRKRKGR